LLLEKMIVSKLTIAFPYILGSFIICIGLAISIRRNGKTASLSTLFHDLISLESTDMTWKGAVIAGLIFGGTLVWNIFSYGPVWGTTFQFYEHEDTFLKGTNVYGFMLSGFLVGLGTSLAGGGITGHVFTGVPKPSLKSTIASVIIFAVGFFVSTMKERTSFLSGARASVISIYVWPRITTIVPMLLALLALLYKLVNIYRSSNSGNEELSWGEMYKRFKANRSVMDMVISFGVGVILAVGLLVSGISDRKKMLTFLSIDDSYLTMGNAFIGGIIGNFIIFHILGIKESESNTRKSEGEAEYLELILGSVAFGAGFGLCGLTIGTAVMVAPLYFPEVYLWYLVPSCFGNIASPYIKTGIHKGIDYLKACCSKDPEGYNENILEMNSVQNLT